MRDTPRTEVYVLDPLPQVVSADWARQLERELNAAKARVAELEEREKQARDDEAWARQNQAWVSLSNEGCWAWEDERSIDARTPTVSAAIRALRAKVEGGKR